MSGVYAAEAKSVGAPRSLRSFAGWWSKWYFGLIEGSKAASEASRAAVKGATLSKQEMEAELALHECDPKAFCPFVCFEVNLKILK